MFGSGFQYQTLPYGFEGTRTSSLISKVMGLLAFSFIFAFLGTLIGIQLRLGLGTYFIAILAGFVVLLILHFAIQVQGLNLLLLYLFTFIEGVAISPIIRDYLLVAPAILGEAFLITAVTSFGLAAYAYTTKRDFSRIGDYLFFGVILLIVAGIVGFFFQSTLLQLFIAVLGIAIFSGYVLFYIQRAKNMADTMPNAIMLTVSIFITVLNLFLYILELLTILSGNNRRR